MSADEGIWNMSQASQASSSTSTDFESISKWTVSDVGAWLKIKGHDEPVIVSCVEQKIDGKCLLLLTESDLRTLPSIQTLGDLKRLYFDILDIQQLCGSATFSTRLGQSPPFPCFPSNVPSASSPRQECLPVPPCPTHHGLDPITPCCKQKRQRKKRRVSFIESDSSQLSDPVYPDNDDEEQPKSSGGFPNKSSAPKSPNSQSNHESHRERKIGGYATNLKPEIGKAIVALGYVFVVTWITSLTMVIVHDRVPSMEKFPPLPDLFLDNIPHIPYAFEMCEITGTILFSVFLGVLIFHKHRFVLIRRFFALSGTVFLLRCVTMLITSLSVPGQHLLCKPRPYETWFQRLYSAYLIWKGAGMSIQGVRTCGDYMFSGHTVALTMLNFFVTEYTTRRMYYIHTLSWLLNMFGIFFILAAHEHYSIDVFIAFYITSRLFLYYHTLANNHALMQRDSKRTKVWFPLFSYFESQVDGIVPNQYEWPITISRIQNWTLIGLGLLETKWKEFIPNPNEGFFRTKFFFKLAGGPVKKDD